MKCWSVRAECGEKKISHVFFAAEEALLQHPNGRFGKEKDQLLAHFINSCGTGGDQSRSFGMELLVLVVGYGCTVQVGSSDRATSLAIPSGKAFAGAY